jgi:DNA-binding NtrC family response regulator
MGLPKQRLVWLLEDEPDLADCYSEMLASADLRVQIFSNPTLALKELSDRHIVPDVVVTDLRMPQMDGMTFIRAIRNLNMQAPVILLSAFLERQVLLNAQQLGVTGFLEKPVSERTLKAEVDRAYDARSTVGLDAELISCLRASVTVLEEACSSRESRIRELSALLNEVDPEGFKRWSKSIEAANARISDEKLFRRIDQLRNHFQNLWKNSRLSD